MSIDLERALTDLAYSLEFPGEAGLSDRVIDRLDTPADIVPLGRRPAVRKALAVAAAAAVIVGVVLVGSPRARRAVADLLGIGGIEIQSPSGSGAPSTDESSSGPTTAPPTFPTAAALDALRLGSVVDVGEGAARLTIPPPLPPALGPPSVAFFGQAPAAGQLSLVWPPSPTLPATRIPGVGALLTVFRARIDEGFFQKRLDEGTTYERVDVGGRPAAWLAGEPHSFLYQAPSGQVGEATLRLAGNTLIWAVGPFTYRLESGVDRDAAIALAESVPVG